MTIRSTLQRLFGTEPAPAAPAPVEMAPDPRGAPGTRVYHEYFVGEQRASDNRFPWLCRVYAQNGAVTEQRGDADTREAARNAALSFAALTKRALRGDA